MIWLLWRQHRLQVALAAVGVSLFALPVAITGTHLRDALTSCKASPACSGMSVFQGYSAMNTLVDLTILVPLLIGVFWGATIVGRELETGTASLAWAQSVTRAHWLRTKLLTLFLFAAMCGGAVSALVTWWSDTHNALMESRFTGFQFDIQGVAPVGYAVFAAAVGLAAGVLWRRALPAMATTIAVFIGVRVVVDSFIRSHYMSPLTLMSGMRGPDPVPSGSWEISSNLTYNGHPVYGPIRIPDECVDGTSRAAMDACMGAHGYLLRTVYQPASRYWTFQWIEFGIFAGLAVALVAVAVLVLRRRDA